MAKSKKPQQKTHSHSHESSLNKLSSKCKNVCLKGHHEKLHNEASKNKEWENAVCSVCMESPHNAVLLLCSSYENGCRPYMCATSHRFSNCLEQYKKTYTKVTSNETAQSSQGPMDDKDFLLELGLLGGDNETSQLLCPLCRGQVKGWTVVEHARNYLNAKKRTCVHENCSFVGKYKEIKKHVKSEHPLARPRDVDPEHAEKWKKLENERDFSDVLSTIRSTMPGAVVIGDYVIERNNENGYSGNALFGFPSYGGRWDGPTFAADSFSVDYDSPDDDFFRGLRGRAPFASRSVRRSVSRITRLHARLLFGRQMGRLGR